MGLLYFTTVVSMVVLIVPCGKDKDDLRHLSHSTVQDNYCCTDSIILLIL